MPLWSVTHKNEQMNKKQSKEILELLQESEILQAESFINEVELNCLFDLGNRERLVNEYLRLLRNSKK